MRKFTNTKLLAALSTVEITVVLGFWVAPANAFDFQFQSSQGVWTEVNEGNNVDNTNLKGLGTNEISWGNELENGQSGLRFEGVGLTNLNYNEVFSLGTLTHINKTIASGSSIVGADLDITLDFTIPNIEEVLNFSFKVAETTNFPVNGECFYGGPTPCQDRVSILGIDEVFSLNGNHYQFTILGWSNSDGEYTSGFLTQENVNTSANLYATINQVNQTQVPEPFTTAGIGLVGLYLVSRRRTQGDA